MTWLHYFQSKVHFYFTSKTVVNPHLISWKTFEVEVNIINIAIIILTEYLQRVFEFDRFQRSNLTNVAPGVIYLGVADLQVVSFDDPDTLLRRHLGRTSSQDSDPFFPGQHEIFWNFKQHKRYRVLDTYVWTVRERFRLKTRYVAPNER